MIINFHLTNKICGVHVIHVYSAYSHLPGNDLSSRKVFSALEVLTSVFGMGTGGTPPV